MKDFLIISLLFTVFSFFSNQVMGQDKSAEKGERTISYLDEDSFVGPRLPPPPPQPPITPPKTNVNKTRTVNLETIDDNGVQNSILTVLNHEAEVSVFEWQGTEVPSDIQKELTALRIDLSTLDRLVRGENLRSKYKYARRQPDTPEMQLIVDEVRNIDGEEFSIHVKASRDGQRKKVTIHGPDESEKSYRWDGDMPKSIREELSRLQPSLLSLLDLDEALPQRVSMGIAIAHQIVKEVEDETEVVTEVFRVDRIMPSGSAEIAGMQVGDELLSIDGVRLSGENSISRELSKKEAGDEIKVLLIRGGEELEVNLKLQARS